MKKYVVLVMLLSMIVVTMPASATSYTCSGPVNLAFVDNGGTLAAVIGGTSGLPSVYFCTVGANNNGWTSDACKAAYATILAGKLSGRNVIFTFNDNLTCSTQTQFTLVQIINVALQ